MKAGGSPVRLVAGLFAGAILLPAIQPYGRAQEMGDAVTVQQVHFWSAPGKTLNHGAFACWLRLRNSSASRPHTVLIRARDGMGLVLEKRLLLPPATQHLVPCILPLAESHGYAEVLVDGRRLGQNLDWAAATPSYQPPLPVLLVSRRLPFDLLNDRLNDLPTKASAEAALEPGVRPGSAGASAVPGDTADPPAAGLAAQAPGEGGSDTAAAEPTDAAPAEPEAEENPDVAGLPDGQVPGIGGTTMSFPGFNPGPGFGPGRKHEIVRLARAEVEAQAWPTDWQFYGGFEGVALTAEEMTALPAEALGALVRYAECGGAVVVLGAAPTPAGWEQNPLREHHSLVLRDIGFGCWVGVPVAAATAATDDQIQGLRDVLSARLLSTSAVAATLSRLPVGEQTTLPIKGTALLVALFALLAGPANLWVLIRLNRRVWMLWTTPVLGATFSVAIVAYFLLGEGVTPHARLQAVTLLNEGTHRATTLGVEGLYCPLPPRGGVAYEADWEVTAGRNAQRWRAREVELTSAVRFRSGWVRSRVPVSFALRGSRHAAERLPLRLEDSRVIAVNGLGAPIDILRVATADGQIWEGRDIAPGAEAVLLVPASAPGIDPGRVATDFWRGQAWLAPLPAGGYALTPGRYCATLRRSVFLKPVLAGAEYQETSLVIGIPATALGSAEAVAFPPDPANPAAGPATGRAEQE